MKCKNGNTKLQNLNERTTMEPELKTFLRLLNLMKTNEFSKFEASKKKSILKVLNGCQKDTHQIGCD